jgi:hypothetical protein
MGDKSPKSKQRDKKQKDTAKQQGATNAKSKQEGYATTQTLPKGKK